MTTPLNRKDLFTPERIAGMINLVQGHSTIAALSNQTPIPFNGQEIFTFTLDNEIDVVAESGEKSPGGATIGKTKMMPIKVEYNARFSDEMWYSGEEAQLNIVKEFIDGYAKKLSRGLDLMAFHSINPRSKQETDIIGNNSFDKLVTQTINYDASRADDVIEDALFLVSSAGGTNTGMALSHNVGRDLSKIAINGVRQFPEFRMGRKPDNFAGMTLDINRTVNEYGDTEVYVGDFTNAFKWGYSKNIGLQILTAGDPDNTNRDLAGHNEIMLRSETYLGWGILLPDSFARVVKAGA